MNSDYLYVLHADIEHWIPILCHIKCNSIFLYGTLFVSNFCCAHAFLIHHYFTPVILFFFFIYFIVFFQVCSWGGYTFIINLIPMHVLLCIVTGRYSSRLYIAYAPLVSILISIELLLVVMKMGYF